tara:strand:- start:2845 stop:3507 length:663 start_codon:yes stop_codon:yes gene_type:complete
MSQLETNLKKLIKGLDSLYNQFESSQKIDSDDFLATRKLGTLQEHLHSQSMHFESPDNLEGFFLVARLSCRRPLSHQVCQIFVYDRIQNKMLERTDPVSFMKNLNVKTAETTDLKRSDLDVFEDSIFSWVQREVQSVQNNCEKEFLEERDRLDVFYKRQFEELVNKKKSVFFHNYFFEKEARIKEDMKQNHSEMKEQEALLALRYQPQFQIEILLHGSLS